MTTDDPRPAPHPQAARVLAELEALSPTPGGSDAEWLAAFRCGAALLRGFGGDPEPVHSVAHIIAGDVPVRLYRPAEGRLPVLLHLHGGGGIAGSVDGHDPALRATALATGWTVAAPDYPLAPARRFADQLEDCRAALEAVAAADEVDADRIVVSGDSIGGLLATALATAVRDRGGPRLAGQALLYSNTDLRPDASYPSRRSEEGRVVRAADLERQIGLHLGEHADRGSPLASPAAAPPALLRGLPPAFVVTGGCDPLRDEGELYARNLAAAGVPVEHHRFDGLIHGFWQMGARIDAAADLRARLARWLGRL